MTIREIKALMLDYGVTVGVIEVERLHVLILIPKEFEHRILTIRAALEPHRPAGVNYHYRVSAWLLRMLKPSPEDDYAARVTTALRMSWWGSNDGETWTKTAGTFGERVRYRYVVYAEKPGPTKYGALLERGKVTWHAIPDGQPQSHFRAICNFRPRQDPPGPDYAEALAHWRLWARIMYAIGCALRTVKQAEKKCAHALKACEPGPNPWIRCSVDLPYDPGPLVRWGTFDFQTWIRLEPEQNARSFRMVRTAPEGVSPRRSSDPKL